MNEFTKRYAITESPSGERITEYNRQVLMMIDWFEEEMTKQKTAGIDSEVEFTIKDITQTETIYSGILNLKNLDEVRRLVLKKTESLIVFGNKKKH